MKIRHHKIVDFSASKSLKKYLNSLFYKPTESINVMRLDEDIIIVEGWVEKHIDNTEKGKISILYVIEASRHFVFETNEADISLSTGDLIVFNGNEIHSLRPTKLNERFIGLIWDIEKDFSYDEIFFDIEKRLRKLSKKYKLWQAS